MEIKVITISDSEESDDSENKRKPRSTLKPNFARKYDESVIYYQKPEFVSDRTFRKREQPVVIIESESEESDDSHNIYFLHGNKKQKKLMWMLLKKLQDQKMNCSYLISLER